MGGDGGEDGGIDAIVVVEGVEKMADLLKPQRMSLWANIQNEVQSMGREMCVGMLLCN